MVPELLKQIILIVIGLLNAAIATFVLLRNPHSIINRSFFGFVFGAAAWTIGIALLFITKNFIFNQLIFYGSTVMFAALLLFSKVFPQARPIGKSFYLLFIPAVLIVLATPFDPFVTGLIVHNGAVEPIIGPALFLFITIITSYFILSVFFLIRNFRQSTGQHRVQLQYLLTGISIFIASSIFFATILPTVGIYELNFLGPTSSLVLIGLTAYAIIRHQLMDIRVIIQLGLVYSILATLVLLFYVAVINIVGFVFQELTPATAFFSAALTTLIAVFSIPIIERYLRKVTDKIFFKDKYDYSEAIQDLSEILNKNIKLKNILRSISETLKSILRIEKVTLLLIPQNILFDEKGTFQKIEKFYSDKLIKERMKHPDVIVHATIPRMLKQSAITATWKEVLREIQRLGEKNKTAVSVPIILEHKLVGFLALGKKLSGDPYTSEDIKLLETFSYQAAVAIEKARLYEEVAEYSRSLEQKVKKRTKEIEQLQEEQKQMIIDISHGLQNPLTVVKNELELLQKRVPGIERISMVEKSIDNVSKFIYDLLSLARLEAARDDDKKELVNLSELLKGIVEYLEVLAKEKNIVLESTIEDGITIDGFEKRLEELVANLVSNAMKYMKEKGERKISISLKAQKNAIVLRVLDSGKGIRSEDLPYIFDRFYRVKQQKKISTGSGLGLAISKRIVEKHGGTIRAKSVLGSGTTFVVQFPKQ